MSEMIKDGRHYFVHCTWKSDVIENLEQTWEVVRWMQPAALSSDKPGWCRASGMALRQENCTFGAFWGVSDVVRIMQMYAAAKSLPFGNNTVELLNEAFAKDPNAIHALMANRYPCNRVLADDPYIQVDTIPVIDGEHFQVGALGLINGILAANGMPVVASKWSTEKDDEGRRKLEGFCEYNKFTLVEVTKPLLCSCEKNDCIPGGLLCSECIARDKSESSE